MRAAQQGRQFLFSRTAAKLNGAKAKRKAGTGNISLVCVYAGDEVVTDMPIYRL